MRAIIGQTKTAVQPTGLYCKIWQRWSKVFINVGLLIVFSYVLHILLNLHFFFLYYISEFKCVVKLLHTDRKRGFTNLASLKYVFFFYHPSLQDKYLPICCLFVRVSQSDNLKQFKGWGFHSYPKLCLIEITFYDIIHSQKKKNSLKLSDEEKSVENSSTFSNSVIDLLPCLGLLSCCMTQFGQALAFEQIHIWL